MTTVLDKDDNPERDQAILRNHVAMLAEHFDTVQIVATKSVQDNGTRRHTEGAGNWYARYGSVKEWITREEHRERVQVTKELESE